MKAKTKTKEGYITQIMSAVVDVTFEEGLPEIFTALECKIEGRKLFLKLLSKLGTTKCVQ